MGTVRIAIKADGCRAWEDTKIVHPGDSIQIGYRYPNCVSEKDSTRSDSTSKE